MCNFHNLFTLHFTTETLNELRRCCQNFMQGWQPQSHALPDVPDAEDSAPKIKANCVQSLMIRQPVRVFVQILQLHLTIYISHLLISYHHFSIYIIYGTYHFSVPCLALPCTDQGVAAVNGHKEVQSKVQHGFVGFNNDADEWHGQSPQTKDESR